MTQRTKNVAIEVRVLEVALMGIRVTDGATEAWINGEQIRPGSVVTMDSPVGFEGTLIVPWWFADWKGLV